MAGSTRFVSHPGISTIHALAGSRCRWQARGDHRRARPSSGHGRRLRATLARAPAPARPPAQRMRATAAREEQAIEVTVVVPARATTETSGHHQGQGKAGRHHGRSAIE